MTKRQVGQCGCELICGQCQMLLQSSEGCSLLCAVQQTQPHFPQTAYDLNLPSFAFAIDDAWPQAECFVSAKPSASFPRPSSSDHHQYGQLASSHQGLVKKLMPSGDGHTLDFPCQVIPANSLSCESKALAKQSSHTAHGVLSFYQAYLTNLIVHFRSCLLSNVHQCLVYQPKVRSFDSPVGAL